MYPFDTLKTQIQSYCADCPSAAAAENTAEVQAGTMMGAWRQHQAGGMSRLWRGAQAMAVGCIPAHAMYFSSYEMIKAFFLQRQPEGSHNMGALGSTVAGSTAALCHDSGVYMHRFSRKTSVGKNKSHTNHTNSCPSIFYFCSSHGSCGHCQTTVAVGILPRFVRCC